MYIQYKAYLVFLLGQTYKEGQGPAGVLTPSVREGDVGLVDDQCQPAARRILGTQLGDLRQKLVQLSEIGTLLVAYIVCKRSVGI